MDVPLVTDDSSERCSYKNADDQLDV